MRELELPSRRILQRTAPGIGAGETKVDSDGNGKLVIPAVAVRVGGGGCADAGERNGGGACPLELSRGIRVGHARRLEFVLQEIHFPEDIDH